MIFSKFKSTLTIWLLFALLVTPFQLSVAFPIRPATPAPKADAHTHSHQEVASPTSKSTAFEEYKSFIIESVDGHSACRAATRAEIQRTIARPDDIAVPVRQLVSKEFLAQVQTSGGDNAANGLTIDFSALSQLQNDPEKASVIAAFERAKSVWTARIKSPVTIQINIDYGLNFPGGEPFPENTLGSTGSRSTLIDYPGARTNLLAGSSSAAETAIYNLLPNGSSVPSDTGNGGAIAVNRSSAFALGIPVTSPSDLNVATMAFNKGFGFDFNPDDGITPGTTDFVAVAVHEIGHALGFTSGNGEGATASVTLWDLFRFRPGTTNGTFSTAQRVMSIGGEQVYFTTQPFTVAGLATNELRLSTGGPEPQVGDGDRRQSSHWKDDDLNSNRFIGIMDPTIDKGVHEEANENDFSAIELLGWNLISSVGPPPAPPAPPKPPNDNFANAQVISGCSGSVNGTNIGATRESGELNHLADGNGGSRSVWYRWQAPSSGSATITTFGSRYDTILGVYGGTSVGSLSPILGRHDDVGPEDRTSRVPFQAVAGNVYRIAVDGYNNNAGGGDFGPITLNWTLEGCSSAPQIMLDQTGPAADQASAVDSILRVRDPFLVDNPGNLLNPSGDGNTRVVLFVMNITGASAAQVVVNLVASNGATHNITAEDVRIVPGFDFSQVTFRLPTGLPAGTCTVKVVREGISSNTATLRIRTS